MNKEIHVKNEKLVSVITADLVSENCGVILEAKQGDINSRSFEAKITISGVEYNIPQGVVARYAIEKPYSTAIWHDCNKIENNIIYGDLVSEAVADEGTFPMHIELYSKNQSELSKLSTVNFTLKVYPSARNVDEQVGNNDYGVLDNLIKEINSSVKDSSDLRKEIIEFKNTINAEEEKRKSSENERNLAEQSRNEAEKLREERTKEIVTTLEQSKTVLSEMRTATEETKQATKLANDAAKRVQDFISETDYATKEFVRQEISNMEFTYYTQSELDNIFV